MLEEHVAEHAAFRELLVGTAEDVAARMDDLVDELDAHMAAEERTFLNAAVLVTTRSPAPATRSRHEQPTERHRTLQRARLVEAPRLPGDARCRSTKSHSISGPRSPSPATRFAAAAARYFSGDFCAIHAHSLEHRRMPGCSVCSL